MKKLLSLLLAAFMVFSLVACSSSDTTEEPEEPSGQEETPEAPDDTAEEEVPEETEEPEIPDLTGEWEQSNKNSDTDYQIATITNDTIEVYWVFEGDDTTALYWAGTFVPPTSDGEYSWDSENDTEQTSSALLASGDETKTFTYSDSVISYDVTAMGVTTTVELEKK